MTDVSLLFKEKIFPHYELNASDSLSWRKGIVDSLSPTALYFLGKKIARPGFKVKVSSNFLKK